MTWSKIYFWIATSVADIPAVNPNAYKTFLANGVSTFLINGKPAVIDGLRKFKNSPSWLVTFLVVHFDKILLFSKDLITVAVIISFITLFRRVIPETLIDEFVF